MERTLTKGWVNIKIKTPNSVQILFAHLCQQWDHFGSDTDDQNDENEICGFKNVITHNVAPDTHFEYMDLEIKATPIEIKVETIEILTVNTEIEMPGRADFLGVYID